MNPVPDQLCHAVLDLSFLEFVEGLGRYADTGHLDSGIEHTEACVLQRLKIVQPRRYSSVAVDLEVLDLVSRDSISVRLGIRRHFFLLSSYFAGRPRRELRSCVTASFSLCSLVSHFGFARPRSSIREA